MGTKRGVTTLSDAKMKVPFSFGYPRNGSTQPGGGAGIDLQFRDIGLMEGAACPIVIAKAYFGGVELPQYATGGAAQCGVESDPACGRQCMEVGWNGLVTPVLEAQPASVDLVIADSSGELTATLAAPVLMADVACTGLADGQEVHHGDAFDCTIQPIPPLQGGQIVVSDVSLATGVYATFEQPQVLLQSVLALAPLTTTTGNAWVLTMKPIDTTATVGPAQIVFNFHVPATFLSCGAGATCLGDGLMVWKVFNVQYAN